MTADLQVELRFGLPEFSTFVPPGWERVVLGQQQVEQLIASFSERIADSGDRELVAEAADSLPAVLRRNRVFGALRAKACNEVVRPYWFLLSAWRSTMDATIGQQIRDRILPGPHALLDAEHTVLCWYSPNEDVGVPGMRKLSYLLPSPKDPDGRALEISAWISTAQLPADTDEARFSTIVDFANRIALSQLWSEGSHVRMSLELLRSGRVLPTSPLSEAVTE